VRTRLLCADTARAPTCAHIRNGTRPDSTARWRRTVPSNVNEGAGKPSDNGVPDKSRSTEPDEAGTARMRSTTDSAGAGTGLHSALERKRVVSMDNWAEFRCLSVAEVLGAQTNACPLEIVSTTVPTAPRGIRGHGGHDRPLGQIRRRRLHGGR